MRETRQIFSNASIRKSPLSFRGWSYGRGISALPCMVAISLGLGLLVMPSASAQNLPPADTSVSKPITSPTYRIAIEDTLDISVVGQNGAGFPGPTRTVTVLADGTADLPYLGESKIAGLTLAQLRKKLQPLAAKELINPAITIAVRGRYVKQVNVFGVLPNRGKIALRENWRVRDVISAAGSFPSDRYEFYRTTFLKTRTGEQIEINLKKLLEEGDQTQNFLVEDNDVLMVQPLAEVETQVQVIGQVAKSGPIPLPRSQSVLEVLQLAGGPTPRASLANVVIRRGGKIITLDLRDYDKTGFTPGEKLQAGDTLVVPENDKVYYITGAASRSGPFPYPEDEPMTVFKAISIAGGQNPTADLREVRLTRRNADGTTTTKTLDVDKMVRTGNLKGDLAVAANDYIYVPPYKKKGFTATEALTAISAAGGAFYLLGRMFKF